MISGIPKPADAQLVKIISPSWSGRQSFVSVDGVEQKNLDRIELTLGVNEVNVVVLRHTGPAVNFEGLARVVHVPLTLEERVVRALERLKGVPGIMRVPADPTDPDLVLADVLEVLKLARKAG